LQSDGGGVDGLYFYTGETGLTPTPGQTYTFSIYVAQDAANPISKDFRASIEFYNNGSWISTINGASATPAVSGSGWTRFSATGIAPAGATRATPTIYSTSATAASDSFFFDGALFEQSATVNDYFDGTTAGFTQANLVNNPSFETGTAGWVAGTNTTIAQNTFNNYVGNASLSLTSVAAGGIWTNLTTGVSATAGSAYTASAYVKSETVARTARVRLDWYNGATLLSTTDGADTTTSNSSWTNLFVTGVAPASTTSVVVTITVNSTSSSSEVHYFDAVLLERSATVNDYYAGNYSPLTQTVNAWTNFANSSTSVQTVYVTTTQTTPTTYRYLLADLVTNQILAELPLTGVSFTSVLNGAGSFSGTMLVTDATQSYLNIWGATQPARTALYVERFSDGGTPTLVWGGIIWARDYNSTTQHITLNASEFESYFDRRKIIAVSGATGSQVYKNADPLLIARTLIQNAQVATATANIGVNVGSESSLATVSKTYFDAELKSVLSAIQDLSHASTSGFDFKIKVAYDAAFNPTKTFTIGYPRLGAVYSSTNATAPVFEFPGNVSEYSLFEDGSLAANYIYAVGVGNGQGKLNRFAADPAQWTAGWPLLEGATNYGDVSNQTLLDNLAAGQLAAVKNPPQSLKVIYPPYQDPILGNYALGDDVRIRINDDRAGQVDDYFRVVSISVTPGENNAGERATLTFTQKGAV
jgi:hypothetical protein